MLAYFILQVTKPTTPFYLYHRGLLPPLGGRINIFIFTTLPAMMSMKGQKVKKESPELCLEGHSELRLQGPASVFYLPRLHHCPTTYTSLGRGKETRVCA